MEDLKSKHRCMMEDMVFSGLTAREVCEKYGMSEGRFSIIKNSPLWKLEERELRAGFLVERRKEMESLLPAAVGALKRNLDCGKPEAEISAAKEILNRGGMPAGMVIEVVASNGPSDLYDTLEDIKKAKAEVLRELGVDSIEDLIGTLGVA